MMKMLLTSVETDCLESKLALKYMYSVVVDAPLDIDVNVFSTDDADDFIYERIVCGQYNIVYFHCDMMNEERIVRISEIVKKAVPTSIVIVGGMQVTFNTEEFMRAHPEVDYVIRGEGEQVMYSFIKTVITYEFDFESISGLAFWDENTIIVNPLPQPMRFEDIPFPYEKSEPDDLKEAYYESFRGCPDRSLYMQYLPDRTIRTRSLKKVFTELRYFLVKEVEKVTFVEKWFNFNPERAFRIWEYLIANDNGVTTFVFDVNGDLIDDETIELLSGARRGLLEFNMDIESTNAEALDAMGRKENIYQLMYNAAKLLRDTKVTLNVFQKAGMPFETAAIFARSFNKIYELGADSMRVDVLRVLKGAALRASIDKFGYRYSSKPPYYVIANDYISAAELIRIKMAAETADNFMTGDYSKTLLRMRVDTTTKPFDLFMALGEYIYKNGLCTKLGKRENMYRILYSFATVLYDEKNETLKLQTLMEIMRSEMEEMLPADAIEKFDEKGWELDV